MKQSVLVLCTVLVLSLAGCDPHSREVAARAGSGAAGETGGARAHTAGFDYYLLNLSWSPEYCQSHPTAQECAAHDAFVLHGLWPQNNDGTYPENCSNAPGPADPSAYKDIYPDAGLLEHEWQTHGTCSGLSADNFFATARKAYQSVTIPAQLANLTAQVSMPPDEVLGLFTASNPGIGRTGLALSCGHNYLTAVEVCLDKTLHPIPCPAVRSCGAKTVKIPAP